MRWKLYIFVDMCVSVGGGIYIYIYSLGDRGSTVVKVLCYKSEGRWLDPSWYQWIFLDIKSLRSHYGPGVGSACNRNEYQENFLGVKRPVRKADNLPPLCAVVTKSGNSDFLEPSGPLREFFTFIYIV